MIVRAGVLRPLAEADGSGAASVADHDGAGVEFVASGFFAAPVMLLIARIPLSTAGSENSGQSQSRPSGFKRDRMERKSQI